MPEFARVLVDDSRTVAPLMDLRASFDVRTGAMTLAERLHSMGRAAAGVLTVPDRRDLLRERGHTMWAGGTALAINGRCPLPPAEAFSLDVNQALVDDSGDMIAAVVNDPGALVSATLPSGVSTRTLPGRWLISRPWHVRSFRDACIKADLHSMALGRPVHAHPTARIHPSAVLDAEGGPIVLDEHAVARPGAILIGPCYVGPHSTVLERATIRPNTAIGPHCKVNGEVGGSIFQGYANKAHDGYLGDSWVGEWVNLGAGTTNSNLLNTYGEVVARATPDGPNERTGEQFLGATIGDHVKTAICTRLFTGCVHTGSMFASTAAVSGCVPAFSWVTEEGRRPYRFDKFSDVMRAAMSRRKVTPSPAYLKAIEHLHAHSR